MTMRRFTAATLSLFALLTFAPMALAHSTGSELTDPSQCSTLPGTSLHGQQGDCLRCVNRTHYHYHTDLPNRQRCHRANFTPHPPHAHH